MRPPPRRVEDAVDFMEATEAPPGLCWVLLLLLLLLGGRAFSRPIRGIMDTRPLGGRLGIPEDEAAAEGSMLLRRWLRGAAPSAAEGSPPASVMRRGLRGIRGVLLLIFAFARRVVLFHAFYCIPAVVLALKVS